MTQNLQSYPTTVLNVSTWHFRMEGGGSKHTLNPPIYFQGVRSPAIPKDLHPCLLTLVDNHATYCNPYLLGSWLIWQEHTLQDMISRVATLHTQLPSSVSDLVTQSARESLRHGVLFVTSAAAAAAARGVLLNVNHTSVCQVPATSAR